MSNEIDTSKPLDHICGFCGVSERNSKQMNLTTGKTTKEVTIRPETVEQIKQAQAEEKMYWLLMCPACGAIAGVQIKDN